MKKALILSLFFTQIYIYAQVPRKIIVEHFTNSVCSVCKSRNPGFYTNLGQQTDVLHLAVYPSSPYSSCVLNKHNVTENDNRTKYYGVYGSTPRLVIQGSVISNGADYSNSSIFTPYLNQMSPADIKISQLKYGTDSIKIRVVVTTKSTHSLGNLKLFVAVVEDTLFYNSPNGEKEHYDVFRKSLTGTSGTSLLLPATVGDSAVYTTTTTVNNAWVLSRIYSLAILQVETTKEVIQAERSSTKSTGTTGIGDVSNSKQFIYPNPATERITVIDSNQGQTLARIFDSKGILISEHSFKNNITLGLNELPTGIYFIQLTNATEQSIQKFIKSQ